MEKIMITVTVNLKGRLGGPVKHTTRQTYSVDVTPIGSKIPLKMTRKIKHTNREEKKCVRKVYLSEEVVTEFQSSETPHWENKYNWSKITRKQRLESYLERFDEGYGYSYEYVDSINE